MVATARRSKGEVAPVPGARLVPGGVEVAVRSRTAEAVEVCLPAVRGEVRVPLARVSDDLFAGRIAGLGPGDRYGLRVHGPYAPSRGLLFDPSRILVDPYARAIDGQWSVVVDDAPADTGTRPGTPLCESVIYEAHVRGLTRLHPDLPPSLRGTYAGLAHPAVVEGLLDLGITAVELLPVHEHRTEAAVAARGLVNFWGYSTLGFLAPHAGYSASGARGGQVSEFRSMVRTLHEAGIEVIVDVVFNHTCEGGPGEPPLAFRGIDNPAYYVLDPADPSRYLDWTGCGNTLDPESPAVQELVLASLRHWALEMGVDGFRFDLAVQLGRTRSGYHPDAPLLAAIASDPALAGLKLIAEPWDLGPDGYRVGGFPAPFAEWNGVYRDDLRDLWRGQKDRGLLARRLAGSDDVFHASGRGPAASVNLVTAHDGFTLADLVAYERKRNDANREGNRDGGDHNRAWNSGVEGPTDDPTVRDVRARRERGMLAALLLSVGAVHLVAGDERGRTQGGNNNAYCQDNPTSWLDWTLDEDRARLLLCVQRLVGLRRGEPLLQRDRFLDDGDVQWLGPDGRVLVGDAWPDHGERALAVRLAGGPTGRRDLLLLLCPGGAGATFALPPAEGGWSALVDTSEATGEPAVGDVPQRGTYAVAPWSVAVLRAAG